MPPDAIASTAARIEKSASPGPGSQLLELGCGPGFYSCRLAERFPDMSVTGVDRSESQLRWARDRAGAQGLSNCRFRRINALELSYADRKSTRLNSSHVRISYAVF